MPVFEVGGRTKEDTVITTLIPDMNFTYNATIAGFIVAGRRFNQNPHSIQIWRPNGLQPVTYYQVERDITVNNMECSVQYRFGNFRLVSCILNSKNRVRVQPGDFLGLQLPQMINDSGIYFTSGGPTNYIFEHKLNSPAEPNNSTVQQRPQIAFNLTLGTVCCFVTVSCILSALKFYLTDQCTCGFPENVYAKAPGEGQGISSRTVTTHLFPNLTFGCTGTIVSLTVAMADGNGKQGYGTKIQIWRENETHSGLYYKIGTDIAISDSLCKNTFDKGTFQCALNETTRVLVQPGDFLGLEIPPTNDDDYEIIFEKNDGSEAYIFQCQLSSTINLSEADNITNNLPQIIPLVILGTCVMLCILANYNYSTQALKM